jgi:hypothetical protein
MLMVVLVMPRPLPPVAVPGPQIAFRSPKLPAAAALVVALGAPADPLDGVVDGLDPDRPHAAKPTKVVAATATATQARDRRTDVKLTRNLLFHITD